VAASGLSFVAMNDAMRVQPPDRLLLIEPRLSFASSMPAAASIPAQSGTAGPMSAVRNSCAGKVIRTARIRTWRTTQCARNWAGL
jgi:hypothetical protein